MISPASDGQGDRRGPGSCLANPTLEDFRETRFIFEDRAAGPTKGPPPLMLCLRSLGGTRSPDKSTIGLRCSPPPPRDRGRQRSARTLMQLQSCGQCGWHLGCILNFGHAPDLIAEVAAQVFRGPEIDLARSSETTTRFQSQACRLARFGLRPELGQKIHVAIRSRGTLSVEPKRERRRPAPPANGGQGVEVGEQRVEHDAVVAKISRENRPTLAAQEAPRGGPFKEGRAALALPPLLIFEGRTGRGGDEQIGAVVMSLTSTSPYVLLIPSPPRSALKNQERRKRKGGAPFLERAALAALVRAASVGLFSREIFAKTTSCSARCPRPRRPGRRLPEAPGQAPLPLRLNAQGRRANE